jgi:AraC-like DNA-binding protein
MILGLLSQPTLRKALQGAASPEEDVLLDEASVTDAVHHAFPRLLVHDARNTALARRLTAGQEVELVSLSESTVMGWDLDRRRAEVLRSREDFLCDRLRAVLRQHHRVSWADLALRDISRAAGSKLPGPLRGFGRRVMEFPARYVDLHALEEVSGLSRGALKARFRRRGLASPFGYLRWFRVMAAAHVLRDPSLTTLRASHRLGFTTDGNFCRSIITTTGLTPTELRSQTGWLRMIAVFAGTYLGPDAIEAWASLDGLFLGRRVA